MATSSFKSTTKRSDGVNSSSKTNPKPKLRRSLSVNALSRSPQIDISNEFFNKTDNPLYWATGGSPTSEPPAPIGGSLESKNSNRGRSVKRNDGQMGEINGRRRSLSRVNNGNVNGRRGRSVSRPKLASESEAEQESRIPITHGGRGQASRSTTGKLLVSGSKSSQQSSRPSFDSRMPNCEDGVSTGSLSEAEEKTIKAVYEQMKGSSSLRKDTASIEIYETVRSEVRRAIADIQDDLHNAIRGNSNGALESTDISPKLVKPGAVELELVLDIRREYAKELEASQERARKLRSDLALEEHHRQELSRILKETLPEPKTSSSHRSRFGRKSSSERKKMSKRLTDEAMSYFDECVSISTFDSSDFSATEDPSVNSTAAGPNCHIDQQIVHYEPVSSSVVDSNCNKLVNDRVVETTNSAKQDRKYIFSFGHNQRESIKLQHDIESYIKTYEKDKSMDRITSRYDYNAYELLDVNASLLFDKVFYRNRQESGSLHLCGGVGVPFLPYPHLF